MRGAATILEKYKKNVMDTWVQQVRNELPAPNQTTDPVLRDHLPLLLDDMISILKRYDHVDVTSEHTNFDQVIDRSMGHGRHRFSSAGYDVEQVLKEYIILHRIITEKLRSENTYTTETGDLLKYIIENSMLYAVVAFNSSHQELQQKLLGVLAHDIRNPASAAYTALGLLQQEDDPERFKQIRDMSRKSIKRSLDLLEDLLESVSVRAGEGITMHFSDHDLMEYIASIYDESSVIYSNTFILNCKAKEIRGIFDTAMIRRVLENIINNAVKYGGKGSPITISVEDTPEKVTISIHNQGNPIPEKKQEDIFKFLNTSNGKGPRELRSWGMGLSLVNTVAKAHGGFLKLVSNQRDGTIFYLVLTKRANQPGKIKTFLNISTTKG